MANSRWLNLFEIGSLNWCNLCRVQHIQNQSAELFCRVQFFPTHHSMPGLHVHHQLLESTQNHVHWVSDAIQPSHPLSSLLLSPSVFPSTRVFSNESAGHQVAKVLELQLQHQSCQWIFRTNFLEDRLVGSPCSLRDAQESSPTPQFKSINSSALSFLYGSTLTSIHDYWKKRSFD